MKILQRGKSKCKINTVKSKIENNKKYLIRMSLKIRNLDKLNLTFKFLNNKTVK